MSSDNIISNAFEGAVKGSLEWSSQKIEEYIEKFKNKKLSFIEGQKTRETVKEEFLSGEAKFYKRYIEDKNLLFLVRLGLGLKKLENDQEKLIRLRGNIYKKYDLHGLHIAEFVQNGILNHYIALIIDGLRLIEDLEKEIENILNNIEKHVIFVKVQDKKELIIKKAITIVDAHSPNIFIVSGKKSAIKIVRECESQLENLLKEKDYVLKKVGEEKNEILFFRRVLRE